MVMSAGKRKRTFTASRLKAELLRVLDDVESTGEPVVVTKHGRAVARLVPMSGPAPLAGSVTFNVDDDELLEPVADAWDAERG
jgi:prevent-host-death family protein